MSKSVTEKAIIQLIQMIIDKFKSEKSKLESIIQSKIDDVKLSIISRLQTVTEEGKYSLDAIENNASINGTLRNDINRNTLMVNRLTAQVACINIYISADGNDVTGDGSESKPFATLLKALNFLASFGCPTNAVVIRFLNNVIIPAKYYHFPPRTQYTLMGEAQFSGRVYLMISGCNLDIKDFKIHILTKSFLTLYAGGSYLRIIGNSILYRDYSESFNISFVNIFGAIIDGNFIFDNSNVTSCALRLCTCTYININDKTKPWIASTHQCILGGTKNQYNKNLNAVDNTYVSIS